jgi:16S rRNA (adenine1518-N6/adenine1519-N6)-dimethyltransferase
MAKKSLSQNFLIDGNYQRKIIEAVHDEYQGQPVLEIGPGHGALTRHLSGFAKSLTLVEKDTELADDLKQKFAEEAHVKVIQADFLDLDLLSLRALQSGAWQSQKTVVVANLPYNVASQILIKIFSHQHLFEKLYLMFQREVGNRCVAKPKTKEYGIFSIWSQLFSDVEKLFDIPPTAFRPQPKITSTFLRFDLKDVSYSQEKLFIGFVRRLFNQRRKKISTTLKQSIDKKYFPQFADKRAEELSLAELKELFLIYAQNAV